MQGIKEEVTEKVLKDLRHRLLNGIDRWLLSDIDVLPIVTQTKRVGDKE